MQILETGSFKQKLLRYSELWNPGDSREISSEELEAHWPASLVRACFDPYGYALGLRGGAILHFFAAQPTAAGDWVRLRQVKVLQGSLPKEFLTDREIDVPVREILWVAEAPA